VNSTTGQFLEAAIRTASPLALAALGETIVERSGIINIGLEGMILTGAFAAFAASTAGEGAVVGLASAVAAGAICAIVMAVVVLALRGDQVIAGTALNLLAFGVTGTLNRTIYGASGPALLSPALSPLPIAGLDKLPVVGSALFRQPVTTYLVYLLVPLMTYWLFRTRSGLSVRAIGESPSAAFISGIPVTRLRAFCLLAGGVLGGLAGGTLVLAQVGTFAEGMSAGRGFIAIAIVVLGRWRPISVAAAALVFGAAGALQFLAQALALPVSYSLILALPYVLTLFALALGGTGLRGWRSTPPPAALGRS